MAFHEARARVLSEPIVSELYTDWYDRVEPERTRRYSIGNVATFCLMAAGSGIVGNIAYEAVERLIARIDKRAGRQFESMVAKEKYLEIRSRLHTRVASSEITAEITIVVRRGYNLLVEGDDGDGANR